YYPQRITGLGAEISNLLQMRYQAHYTNVDNDYLSIFFMLFFLSPMNQPCLKKGGWGNQMLSLKKIKWD
ncbi:MULTISPECIES: hypothetical protein, partial [Cyanophyceae]|uniref:hypothetical protein n=1 Tax=Cyanophyceae TaxID=3028117 RepID=UPI001A7E6A1C